MGVAKHQGLSGSRVREPPAQGFRRPLRGTVRVPLGALACWPVDVDPSGRTPREGSGAFRSRASPSVPVASTAAFSDARARRLDVTVAQMIQPVHPMSNIAIKTSLASTLRPPCDTGGRVQV